MDRAEIISLTEALSTRAGDFTDCLKTREGSGLNPMEKEFKLCAPNIGLLQDEDPFSTEYGFVGD